MKKREFFKRLLGITAAAVVAPKVLLAEETPKEVVVGDSRSFNGLYEPSTLTTGSVNTDKDGTIVEIVYHESIEACAIVLGQKIRVGDIVLLRKNNLHQARVVSVMTYVNKNPEIMGVSQRISIRSIVGEKIYLKKGEKLACLYQIEVEK